MNETLPNNLPYNSIIDTEIFYPSIPNMIGKKPKTEKNQQNIPKQTNLSSLKKKKKKLLQKLTSDTVNLFYCKLK